MKGSLPLEVIDELDKTMCYLLSSASSYIDEPRHYVPIRLLEGVSNILVILSSYDEKYFQLFEEIEEIKLLALESEEEYLNSIDKILRNWIKVYEV